MINITFPDGNSREYEAGTDGFAVALSISKSLSKKAVALKVDGMLCDLSKVLDRDAAIEIVPFSAGRGIYPVREIHASVGVWVRTVRTG